MIIYDRKTVLLTPAIMTGKMYPEKNKQHKGKNANVAKSDVSHTTNKCKQSI